MSIRLCLKANVDVFVKYYRSLSIGLEKSQDTNPIVYWMLKSQVLIIKNVSV